MWQKRWQGCVFLMLAFLLCTGSGMTSSETSRQSEFAMIVQTKQARVCGADPQLLSSLAGSDAEVMVTVPNERLEHIASFQEESDLWVIGHVARFLPTTRITHVLAGDDVITSTPGSAYFLVPAMLNLRSSLAVAGIDDRVVVTSALSAEAVASPAWSDVAAHMLRFLRATGAPLFVKSPRPSEASDENVDAAFAAMRALGVSSGVSVVAGELGARRGEVATYYTYSSGTEAGGKRRSLASGTFCVALQNADPTALQTGLNWACGPGHADCSAIQPGGPCYQENNLPALASYAFNDYYQKQSSTGATCSFNGIATTTTSDPSSGSCVFSGSSSSAGGSNSTTPVGATPPTSLAPPAGGFTPPVGSSPPSSDFSPPAVGTTNPTGGFGPPTGGFGPPSGGFGSPPGAFNGSGSFGPSALDPYGAGCRGAVSSVGLTALSAVAVSLLLVSMDVMRISTNADTYLD